MESRKRQSESRNPQQDSNAEPKKQPKNTKTQAESRNFPQGKSRNKKTQKNPQKKPVYIEAKPFSHNPICNHMENSKPNSKPL
jgi:hypothetical protein